MAPIAFDARFGIERALPVQTYDIDFAGTVGNIVFVRWLEDLRLALMQEVYPIAMALAEDVAPILRATRITYAHPVDMQDALVGRIWVTEMQRVRWTIAAEFLVGSRVHASAEQDGLFIRLSTRRPVAVPEALRLRYGA
jgi:acyl-CoA thioester hydrolase